ncbi:beta-lactamase [Fusarium coicis]|nr:beta-lactamase [Fusarium coicis]
MSVLSQDVQSKLRGIINEYATGVTKSKIPGLVYSAFRNDGEPIIQHYSGLRGVTSESPMSKETIFFMASFTKLATSVACMQLVEQGTLLLDDADQVEAICPELRDVKVLVRNENGNFELVEKVRRITLRMLLTHTAGFGYAFEDEKLAEFSRPIGFDDFSGEAIDTANRHLVNQPGETFQYGVSMDWVGVIIERTYNKSLEEVFKDHIFRPLGMDHVTFHPSAEDKLNLAYMHRRSPSGKLSTTDHFYRRPLLAQDGEKVPCSGGHGCLGRPAEFGRIISLLLNDRLDAKSGVRLLKAETVNDMFTDQIPDKPRFSNVSVPVAKPELANPTPLTPMPDDHTEGWGLSFSINHFPESTGRAAGSASWEGLANLFWFADRKNNIGGIILSQILPYGGDGIMTYQSERDAQFNALIDVLHSVKSDIFDPFTITRTYYESAGIQIGVDVLIPRRLKSQNPPVIVRIHGGFLITGSSLFPAWFSKWVLDFAEEQDAVIISPNYRLLPEVKGRDIIHDMDNFWNWVHCEGPSRHLAEIGQHQLQLNLDKTLAVGESAGGYLALQSVLSGFVRPKAIIALYPMVDMKAAHFTESYAKSIVGVPNYPNEDVNRFLSATVVKSAITEADPPVRLDSAMAVVHNGRYLELLGEDPDLFILERIKRMALSPSNYEKSLFPPLFLLHGEGDTAVPVVGTRKLVDCLQDFDPSTQIHLAVRPGDHGFDFKATIDEPWLREGLDFIVGPWLHWLDSKILI